MRHEMWTTICKSVTISNLICLLIGYHSIFKFVEGAPRAEMKSRKVIVVSGNFSIDGQFVNMAQYDIAKKE
jgi:hypothetical protein